MTLTMPIDPLARRICDVYAMHPHMNNRLIVDAPPPPKPVAMPALRLITNTAPKKRHRTKAQTLELRKKLVERAARRADDGHDLLSFAKVMNDAVRLTGIPADQVLSRTRILTVVKVRCAIVFVLRQRSLMSYPQIGRLMDGRDHTTIINAERKAGLWLGEDRDFRLFVKALGGVAQSYSPLQRQLSMVRKIMDAAQKVHPYTLERTGGGFEAKNTARVLSCVLHITRRRMPQMTYRVIAKAMRRSVPTINNYAAMPKDHALIAAIEATLEPEQ